MSDGGELQHRRKRFYYVFAIVATIFLQFQVSRLWLNRKRPQFTPEELMQRAEALKKRLAEQSPEENQRITQQPIPSPVEVKFEERNNRSFGPSTPTPPPSFSYLPHTARPRLFAYFIVNGTQLKIDLFYDTYPDAVSELISAVSGCQSKKDRRFKIKRVETRVQFSNSEYAGFLFREKATQRPMPIFIFLNQPTPETTKGLEVIGGAIDQKDQVHFISTEDTLLERSKVLFTYVDNEDSNENYSHFEKMLKMIKLGCEGKIR